jgi:hypothetical protein
MRLWQSLYLAIWVVFLEFLLSMIPFWQPLLIYLHAVLGLIIIYIAYHNFAALRATTVPGRLKRIASATFSMSILMAFLGPLIFFNIGAGWPLFGGITLWNAILFIHVVTAFGIITQIAATAVAYDMWEEKEFLEETHPGKIPPNPAQMRTKSTP